MEVDRSDYEPRQGDEIRLGGDLWLQIEFVEDGFVYYRKFIKDLLRKQIRVEAKWFVEELKKLRFVQIERPDHAEQPGERFAVKQVIDAGREYGFANLIAYLKRAWAEEMIADGKSVEEALLEADAKSYPPRLPKKGKKKWKFPRKTIGTITPLTEASLAELIVSKE